MGAMTVVPIGMASHAENAASAMTSTWPFFLDVMATIETFPVGGGTQSVFATSCVDFRINELKKFLLRLACVWIYFSIMVYCNNLSMMWLQQNMDGYYENRW